MAMGGKVAHKNHVYLMSYLSLTSFHKRLGLFWSCLCTNGVGFQVLPFIDNRHFGNIHRFQQYSCVLTIVFIVGTTLYIIKPSSVFCPTVTHTLSLFLFPLTIDILVLNTVEYM